MSNDSIAQQWKDIAMSDRGVAEIILEQYPDQACFHCQQYAEKMLKAYLILADIEPPRTHSIILLLNKLVKAGYEIDDRVYRKAAILEEYAVGTRYPNGNDRIGPADAEEAYKAALALVEQIEDKHPQLSGDASTELEL